VATPAAAQVVRAFTQRFSTNVAGDISLIGNTLLTCPHPGPNGCDGNNNNYDMVYVKDTPDPTVLNRSTATLALPTGATVAWAGLYWGGRSRDGNDIPPNRHQMQFRTPQTPAGTYERITSQIPLDTFANNGQIAYQGFAEVTALVQAGGSGPYVGADVQTEADENGYGGWALVVVFASPAFPTRNLIVFDGFANVSQGEGPDAKTVETTITGFLTPLTGAFTTRVGMVVYEGDGGGCIQWCSLAGNMDNAGVSGETRPGPSSDGEAPAPEVGLIDQGAPELAADRRRQTSEEQVADAATPGFSIK
jgi:hypothetical protein